METKKFGNPWCLRQILIILYSRFKEVSSDYDIAGGGVIYKLLMRAFPGWYRANSVYALYPFSTPDRMKEIFSKNGIPYKIPISYDSPVFISSPIPITTWQGVVDILHDQKLFKGPCKSPWFKVVPL